MLWLLGVVAGVLCRRVPEIRILAWAAVAAAIAYVFMPTGADVQHGSWLFEVNLRYLTPALVLGLPLVAIVTALRRPGWLSLLDVALLIAVVLTQLERSVWPAQFGRHVAFLLVLCVVALAGVFGLPVLMARRRALPLLALASVLVAFGLVYVIERHYFARRYLVGERDQPAVGALYRWAQDVGHARIALYGLAANYPLYGARDTNVVDYLGRATGDGSFVPIGDCQTWRQTVNRGRYAYLVLTPAPTRPIPASWTATDPAAVPVLRPAGGLFVFKLQGQLRADRCP
jgi:hypothetical protein